MNVHNDRARRVLLAGCFITLLGLLTFHTASADGPQTIELGGVEIDARQFSLRGMISSQDAMALESYRVGQAQRCMADGGVSKFDVDSGGVPPRDEDRDDQVGVGLLGAAGGGTTHEVKMPDGSTYAVTATWTPDSCRWRSFELLGSDPLLREALRQYMMALAIRADRFAEERDGVRALTESVARCLGTPPSDASVIFRALDDRLGPGMPPSARERCLGSAAAAELATIRGSAHVQVAKEHLLLVDAWRTLLARELHAAGLA